MLPNGKSDKEAYRNSNRGPFACQANALPTELQDTVRGGDISRFSFFQIFITSHLIKYTVLLLHTFLLYFTMFVLLLVRWFSITY